MAWRDMACIVPVSYSVSLSCTTTTLLLPPTILKKPLSPPSTNRLMDAGEGGSRWRREELETINIFLFLYFFYLTENNITIQLLKLYDILYLDPHIQD